MRVSISNYDASCFHSQQMAEKYLKALLQEHQSAIPKTHNLIALLELCLPIEPTLELQRDILIVLDRYAVQYRYPGESADKLDAKRAYKAAQTIRTIFRNYLRLTD